MQELIDKYFNALCKDKFFKNDDEEIIGKAKDVVENLNDQIEYANNPKNELDEYDREFIADEATNLIQEIENTYSNKDNVIKIVLHPMAGYYGLQDKETLLEELQEYYKEVEEK